MAWCKHDIMTYLYKSVTQVNALSTHCAMSEWSGHMQLKKAENSLQSAQSPSSAQLWNPSLWLRAQSQILAWSGQQAHQQLTPGQTSARSWTEKQQQCGHWPNPVNSTWPAISTICWKVQTACSFISDNRFSGAGSQLPDDKWELLYKHHRDWVWLPANGIGLAWQHECSIWAYDQLERSYIHLSQKTWCKQWQQTLAKMLDSYRMLWLLLMQQVRNTDSAMVQTIHRSWQQVCT